MHGPGTRLGTTMGERVPDHVDRTAAVQQRRRRRDGFGPHRRFEVLIAEVDRKAVGFALFFPNYSTWEGKPGLYIEDIFVDEAMRGTGIGRKLIAAVAKIAHSRGCARIDLAVLNWNPARGFYSRIGFRHAEPWQIFRLEASGLGELCKEAADFVV